MAEARAKLDAAKAAGIRLIIGIYAFGGPEPYIPNGSSWTISAAAQQMLDYFETRQDEIIATFVFNEPYWLNPLTGASDACGAMSAAQLRSLRTEIKKVWPAAKIYHDLGQPAGWAPGGYLYNAHPCIGDKYADATGVADYVGVYDYPFTTAADQMDSRSRSPRLPAKSSYVANKMGAVPVWLAQFHKHGVDGLLADAGADARPKLLDQGGASAERADLLVRVAARHLPRLPRELPGVLAVDRSERLHMMLAITGLLAAPRPDGIT